MVTKCAKAKIITASLATLMMSVCVPTMANAQDTAPERGVRVTDRPRPETDATGIGGFKLFPRISVTESYDDNIFAEENNEEGDFITTVRPELAYQSDWNNHSLSTKAFGQVERYADNPGEDNESYGVSADGRLDVSRDSAARANAGYKRLNEGRGSPDSNFESVEPTKFDVVDMGASYKHQFNRVSAGVGAAFQTYDFKNGVTPLGADVNNNDRDRSSVEGNARLGYEVQDGYEAFVNGEYKTISYESDVDDNGFDRDSDGYRLTTGVSADIGGLVFGDVFAGYQSREYDDNVLEDVSGAVYGLKGYWNVTELATITAGIDKVIGETTQDNFSGTDDFNTNAKIDYEVMRNLLLNANVGLQNREFKAIDGFEDRDDDTFTAGIGAEYFINRNLEASANYTFTNRDSNLSTAEFERNLFIVRLTAKM